MSSATTICNGESIRIKHFLKIKCDVLFFLFYVIAFAQLC